ncbi:DPP IV N-terminal domain-containing protein [Thalassoglobus sp. JC818]|uniref:S9 family peptidase n=1 Tax=Thalassoglobus sp. JC818 TaxID=3232136 RepID=UPI00345AD4B3
MQPSLSRIATYSLLAFALSSHVFCESTTSAQGTADDYARSESLRKKWTGTVYRDRVDPHWSESGNDFWYRVQTGKNQYQYIVVNATSGTRQPAFNHEALAKQLSEKTGKSFDADRLDVESIEWNNDSTELTISIEELRVRSNLVDGTVEILEEDEEINQGSTPEADRDNSESQRERGRRSRGRTRSPDGKFRVQVDEGDLIVLEGDEEDSREILRGAGSSESKFTDSGAAWSPDLKKLVGFRRTDGQSHLVHYVESSPTDQLQPKTHSHQYLKPGDDIPQHFPVLFHLDTRSITEIDDELFSNPWMSIPRIHWLPDSSQFLFVYNQRGHQVLRVISVDAETGKARTIVDEQSDTFIDYAYKQFIEILPESNELIWMSERDGWNHLYLYDIANGEVKNQITSGDWVVRKVVRVDPQDRVVWFECSGVNHEQDPYYTHFARVNFDGSDFTVLTEGDGTHSVQLSPNERYLIDQWSRVDLPPQTELRDAQTGQLICQLEQADASELNDAGWIAPERFVTNGRDDQTQIYGIIFRPTNFQAGMKYPVIEKIYAGPHGSFVPKRFQEFHSAQEVAEIGFIVVQIDGMGTSNRSKAFHDICWQNLGDSGFPDRIKWIKKAAETYPEFDLSPGVGIYGGSAGGQSSTRALLAHGDFYSVAVSDCGCHDNRMDKIWWNELWMGWPIGPHYEEQSNVTNADKLQGKLFLTVGEKDTNVDPASTMQVVNALIKANKKFDMLVVPGHGHGVGEIPYMKRRRIDFFVEHLMGKTPPN